MRIAVASQNFRTITGHAGRTRRFIVFELAAGAEPQEVERLDLPKDQALHEFNGAGAHPLDGIHVVIAGSAGPGCRRKLEARGIRAVATAETDPARAAALYASGALMDQGGSGHGHDCCDHDHGDDPVP